MNAADETIFVAIAAYRDPETQWTIKDLFDKAANPSRVSVGVFFQRMPEADDECFKVLTRPDQVRVLEIDAREAQGVCWARSKVFGLRRNEDFTLQIDAHMRFIQDWDLEMIETIAACPSEQAVISTYPGGYKPPDALAVEGPNAPALGIRQFTGGWVVMNHRLDRRPEDVPKLPSPGAPVAGGFLFGRSKWVDDVPYDPHLNIAGEEITMAARLWTSGWDVYAPPKNIVYHLYNDVKAPSRPLVSTHLGTEQTERQRRSTGRANTLLGIDPPGAPEDLVELDRYGLGTVRTLEEFARHAGIDMAAKVVSQAAFNGRFPRHPLPGTLERQRLFTARFDQQGGLPTKRSPEVRAWLSDLLERLEVHRVADAGCGDPTELLHLFGARLYLGYDIVEAVVARNQQVHGETSGRFFAFADLVNHRLPGVDLLLCLDVLEHQALEDVAAAVESFRASGTPYLVATAAASGPDGFYLGAPEHGLGPPLRTVSGGPDEPVLGLWRLNSGR